MHVCLKGYAAVLIMWIGMAQGSIRTAWADDFSRLTVVNRQSLYDDQPRHRSGSILWQPLLDLTYQYTDNLRATPFNTLHDSVMTISPTIRFRTDRPDQGVAGLTQIRTVQFARYTDQDQVNGTAQLQPYYHFAGGWSGASSVTATYDHELPSSESAQPLADEPTPYRQLSLATHMLRDARQLAMKWFASYELLTFGNTELISGGRAVNNDRNRSNASAGVELFVHDAANVNRWGWRSEILQQNFQRADFSTITASYTGFNRDADGWRSQLTYQWEMTPLITLTGQAGAEKRSFAQAQWDDKTSLVGLAKAIYRLTPLTNILFDLERSVETTAFDNAPAFTANTARVELQHEIRRNLVLDTALQRGRADYWDTERDDTTTAGTIGLSYRQNRHVTWRIGYQHQQRDSSFNLADFDENRLTFGTRIQF